ncbi:hydroxyisourate hydrolase [Nocardioides mangrovi]|uniref:5-hydroxyisourate hydrolase n=1 Tax=Nocardioides mangrovi TaxID=2874580 RepID=A0ABS7UGA2_9ACTN|nr:hydroxyisourate hydrolase [Nocardioides mangrovi]MBZ5740063.1 hydroxyisourate hydrolase [Nocardioides mangrovi]
MTTLSTHVLDAATGDPAPGLMVVLHDGDGEAITGRTDEDGRIRFDVEVGAGTYQLVFDTGSWFAAHDRPTFYPEVVVTFEVEPGREHLHVPLLLSPFAYTTYRGS